MPSYNVMSWLRVMRERIRPDDWLEVSSALCALGFSVSRCQARRRVAVSLASAGCLGGENFSLRLMPAGFSARFSDAG